MLVGAPLAAFAEFGKHMVDSWDIDPVYPVLAQVIADDELDEQRADWLTVLYLAYYDLSSAVTAFQAHPNPADSGSILDDYPVLRLPTGIERRGLRGGGPMREHLLDWLTRFDGRSFFTGAKDALTDDPLRNDSILSSYFTGVKFNGRWAAYKGCEVMHKVRGYANAAPDAGHENSSGPRKGLTVFFPRVDGNGPHAIGALDRQTDILLRVVAEHGLKLEVEEVETLLCDFRSLTSARYVVGHDTDLMLEGIYKAPEHVRRILLGARVALPGHYRGELHGWRERDRVAMRAYLERGEVLHREPPDGRYVEGP